jgi:peptidyl-prolyl cis-trans isomerase SurA
MENSTGDFAYRLLKLIDQTEPHKANIQDDYQMIQGYALSSKQYDQIAIWVNERVNTTFIKINDDFNHCLFNYDWVKKP